MLGHSAVRPHDSLNCLLKIIQTHNLMPLFCQLNFLQLCLRHAVPLKALRLRTNQHLVACRWIDGWPFGALVPPDAPCVYLDLIVLIEWRERRVVLRLRQRRAAAAEHSGQFRLIAAFPVPHRS